MVNSTLVKRLARADGILLRPDRPLAPMDVMFGALLGEGVRAMPGLCTPAQEREGANASCGARLWQTHATVAPEVSAKAPELATAPTRRLVSHGGIDATDLSTVPSALEASAGRFLMQHLVVSVDQPSSFSVLARDLYPLPVNSTGGARPNVFFRSAADGGKPCVAGTDAVASGCVGLVSGVELSTPLFDVSTAGTSCSQLPYTGAPTQPPGLPGGPNCLHEVGVWQAWAVDAAADFVLLGDLSVYVSLSGYRLRLPEHRAAGESFVVVGMPEEKVELTYLRRGTTGGGAGGAWKVHVQSVVTGASGRVMVSLA